MWRLPFRQSRPKTPPFVPRLLVIIEDYDRALALSSLIEREGCTFAFLTAGEMEKAEALEPAPNGVLVAPDLPTADKEAVCLFLRDLAPYAGLPVVAVVTLAEGKSRIAADLIVRPPETVRNAVQKLREMVLKQAAGGG